MNERIDDFWKLTATYRRFQKHKLCLAENRDDPCNSRIIQAHTIPRSQLKQIARNGKVYAAPSLEDSLSSKEMPMLREVGINTFSTLNCFCARHDKSIFSDVEDAPLTLSQRQLAILHYRTVGAELYKKIRSSEASSHNVERLSRKEGERLDDYRAFARGGQIAIRDGKAAFDEVARVVNQEIPHDRLSALVVRFKRLPSIMTVGGFYPEFDFNGRMLQRLGDEQVRYETVSFNILISEGCAVVVLIWWRGHDRCLKFARSYAEQRPDRFTTLAMEACFEHLENTCVRPEWWETVRFFEQKLIVRRLLLSGGILEDRDSGCLQFTGVTHDDWGFDGLEFVNT